MSRSLVNVVTFVVLAVACIAVAVASTLLAARTAGTPPASLASAPMVPLPIAAPVLLPPDRPLTPPGSAPRRREAEARPYLIAVNVRDSPDLGRVEFASVDTIDDRTTTALRCERIHFAANRGICLSREITLFSARTIATLVDAAFQPLSSVRIDGIPTRARVSPDGRRAAFTVFVTGHSYADSQLSTATLLLDIASGTTLANLEEFEVSHDGRPIKSPDFNYWGVTFERDSNFFYATLRTGGVNYLVRGDISARAVTVVHQGVECPSLSPDGTRIAFKKMLTRGNWRLAILSLATLDETVLPETRSVDDQAEWLDDGGVLYGLVDSAPWMNVMVVATDGRSQPQVFARGAASPAVVRERRR